MGCARAPPRQLRIRGFSHPCVPDLRSHPRWVLIHDQCKPPCEPGRLSPVGWEWATPKLRSKHPKAIPGTAKKKGPTHTKSIWPVGLRRHHTPQSMMPSACAPAPPHHNVGRTRSAPAAAKKKRPNLFDLGGILFLTTLCLGEGGLHHQCSLPRQTRATRKRTCTSRFGVGPFFSQSPDSKSYHSKTHDDPNRYAVYG